MKLKIRPHISDAVNRAVKQTPNDLLDLVQSSRYYRPKVTETTLNPPYICKAVYLLKCI